MTKEEIKTFRKELQEKISQVSKDRVEYLNSKNIQKYSDLNFISSLKGFWSFGNSKTKPVKEKMRAYVYNATGKKTEWVINGLIIAVLIFIFSRAVIKK